MAYRTVPKLATLAMVVAFGMGATAVSAADSTSKSNPSESHDISYPVHYRYAQVGDVKVFYREAGNPSNPTVLLLHGYPTSSFMYRGLIPLLAQRYHVVAPDMPGFGLTESPSRDTYAYTFENITNTIKTFTEHLQLKSYALQVFDYGAPVGWRLAAANPERITAIITQNGNAYEEGLGEDWADIEKYWKDPSEANRNALRPSFELSAIKDQYVQGIPDETLVAPETYLQDAAGIARPGNADIQLDLFLDYRTNVALYPSFQAYFRAHQPPLLAVWGKNDPYFTPPGAEAFKRDLKNAEIHFFDTGHFALETHGPEIATHIIEFLDKSVKRN